MRKAEFTVLRRVLIGNDLGEILTLTKMRSVGGVYRFETNGQYHASF